MVKATTATRRIHPAALLGATFLLLAALAAVMIGASAPARAGMTVFTAGGAAIEGYDPVAYFKDGKAVAGQDAYTHKWMDVTWKFASAEHRDAFAASPEKFAPQYGGFCAWAVSQGYTAKIDPAAWHIENGKLYLNYNKSVQSRWAKDIPGNVAKADGNWTDIMADLAKK